MQDKLNIVFLKCPPFGHASQSHWVNANKISYVRDYSSNGFYGSEIIMDDGSSIKTKLFPTDIFEEIGKLMDA